MAISDSYLTELRSKNDIENIISSYVNLKRNGRILKGLCPFHNEKTPSFTVYPDTQSYYCFGCGAGGDVITFMKSIDNLDYVEAVKTLAERAGMPLPESNFDDGMTKRRQRMFEANREAAKFYYQMLYSEKGKTALDYFHKRGLTDETIKHFGLGFAPESFQDGAYKYLKSKGFSDLELFQANLIRKSMNGNGYYDAFKNRVMFPIIDIRGNVIAFSGRTLEKENKAKYVNTGDTLVYKKGNNIFALNFAKSSKLDGLILCEGNMDVIALHQAGFDNAVAGLGTALTDEQASLISRYAKEVYLCYDADEAGQKAANRAISIFSKTGIKMKVLHLTGGKDPDEILQKCGADYFRNIINGAANDIEFKLLNERQKYDVSTSDGKLNFLNAAVEILSGLSNQIEKDIYSTRLSEELGVEKSAIAEQIKHKSVQKEHKQKKIEFKNIVAATVTPKDTVNPERTANVRAAKAEDILLANLISSPDCYKSIDGKITKDDFVTAFNSRIFSIIGDRIKESRPLEPIYLAEDFSNSEMSGYIRLQNMGNTVSKTVKECEDCIKVIISEKYKKKPVNTSNLSDDDFMSAFKDIKNQ